jgi:carbon monoxide dehydrogenase subunit G
MRPINVSIDVPQPREDVYAFLDVLANHERFTDHMMRDWQLQGPERGLGGKAKLNAVIGGRTEPIEIEVIGAEPPTKSVERNTGAGGKRVATGTYTLDKLPDGGTRINFEYAWQQAPLSERLSAPIVRRIMRSALEQALERLAKELQDCEFTKRLDSVDSADQRTAL